MNNIVIIIIIVIIVLRSHCYHFFCSEGPFDYLRASGCTVIVERFVSVIIYVFPVLVFHTVEVLLSNLKQRKKNGS